MALDVLSAADQVAVWDARVNDPRGRLATGIPELDRVLHRGGFAPQEFCILGGRTGTRKTTTMLNMIAGFLNQDVSVGLIGLDESPASYAAKLCSTILGVPHEYIEEHWNTDEGKEFQQAYLDLCQDKFAMSSGYVPTMDNLNTWLDVAEVEGTRPEIVFIDYADLLAGEKYDGSETQRIPRILKRLQIWTNEQEIVTVCLHQVGRLSEGSGERYHGDTPMTPESLMYGGEAIADIILSTYRPAKDPLGNMAMEEAMAFMGERYDEEKYQAHRSRVLAHRDHTFLQLIKNRPGTRLHEQGICLTSPDESMRMTTPGMRYDPDTGLLEED